MTDGADKTLSNTNGSMVAWVSAGPAPALLQAAAAGRWGLLCLTPDQLEPAALGTSAVAVVDAACDTLDNVLQTVRSAGVAALLLGATDDQGEGPIIPARAGIDAAELTGMLSSAAALAPSLRQLQDTVARATADADSAIHSADTLDEEMRLASKLQQDFLPRRLPSIGGVRFGVLYRPASWVSGDIYDVTRLDESHIGFYVADAVGHGMPAALLTMFIKEAMQTKRISGHSYELVPPGEALAALNADLCRQRLSMCEFCTAIYGIIDCTTGLMTLSRAGHPPPIHVSNDGTRQKLDLPGPLLGVIEEAEYEARQFQLGRGQRLVLYSDGLEDAVCGKGATDFNELIDLFHAPGQLSRQDLIMDMSERLNKLPCEDDVTLLLVERE